MNRSTLTGAALTLLVLLAADCVIGRWRGAVAQPPARAATIDAARYPHLQAAVDAVPEAGGVVQLPPGTFELTRPLLLTRENTRIEGAGAATHLVNRNQEGLPALLIRPANRAADARARMWRVQVGNLRLSGNPKSGDGLRAEGVNEIYLHGLSLDHHGGHGINLVDCYEDPRVVGCLMTYNGQAGLNLAACHDIVVSGSQFEENQDALRCADSFNLCMTGNCVDDHLRHGVIIENTYGSVLSGNMIEECRGTAVILDRDCYGITVSANVIAHNGGGVDLRDAWGCAVSANTFTIVAERALAVGPGSGRITVTGNNFSNSHIGGMVKREDAAAGVLLQTTSDIAISGNVFTGLARNAIEAQGVCRRVAISGNVMADLNRKGGDRVAAIDIGLTREPVVAGNAVEER